MTDRELMQMALDVLESSRVFVTSREKIKHPEGTEWYDERIEALRARLAQPEQEQTRSQKMRDAGITRRPKRWDKDGDDTEQEPNDNQVICPSCCHQFRAIPVNVQQLMVDAGFEPPFTTPPQPKQEPVATLFGSLPVYDVPPAKPVAWVENLENARPHCVTDLKYCSVAQHERGEHLKYIPLYTAPPQSEWVGLTDKEKLTIVRETDNPVDALAATEAKLKEKNHDKP